MALSTIGPPALLRVPEAAETLGISRAKAYELIAAGGIPSIRVGASVRVPRQALLDWIEHEMTRPGEPRQGASR